MINDSSEKRIDYNILTPNSYYQSENVVGAISLNKIFDNSSINGVDLDYLCTKSGYLKLQMALQNETLNFGKRMVLFFI